MHVGVIVDHPKRDLAGVVMLAHHLVREGARATVVPLYEQGVDIPLLSLDAVVVNYLRPTNRKLVETYAALGTRIYVLDTEGGVLAEDGANTPAVLARTIRDSGYGELISGYFFWGARLHDAFVAGSGIAAERLHVTGCPRFDFAAPRWRALLTYGQSGYILVNANFPLVNPRFVRSTSHERDTLVAAGWNADYVDRLIDEMRQAHERYIKEIQRLALALPHKPVLVRPHPFENDEVYRQAFAGCPNVTVDSAGSVLNVINNADVVIHLNCGTAIEAVMLGKLPVQLQYLNTPGLAGHATLPARISHSVNSFEELCATVADVLAAASAFDFSGVYDRYILPFFHHNDGQAALRVARTITADLRAAPPRPRRSLRAALASGRADATPLQRLKGGLSQFIGSRAASWLRATYEPVRRDKRVSVQAVAALADRIANQDDAPHPLVRHARHPMNGLPLASITLSAR